MGSAHCAQQLSSWCPANDSGVHQVVWPPDLEHEREDTVMGSLAAA
jgi:hypothetical protein